MLYWRTMDEHYYTDSIFWIEVEKIKPNPFQPRKTFNEIALASLAESIRQYGVLQPLVVTRKEVERPGEGLFVEYELISGERRLRASKIAGVSQVPCVIRSHDESDKMKLELAIIENLQREDLNPVDRARAFVQLVEDFGLKHAEVGKRVGKSREYVSNTLRILALPEEMQEALAGGQIMEGHTRPLLMLSERKEEQAVLFKEVIDKKMTVRETERIARRIAVERARKKDLTPELLTMEKALTETLGTRVTIDKKENGGKVHIDFFSKEDLDHILQVLLPSKAEDNLPESIEEPESVPEEVTETESGQQDIAGESVAKENGTDEQADDLYSIKNFSV